MPDRQGEEERFLSLYRSTSPRLVAYAMRRCASAEDAADVVAETFSTAWRRLEEVPAGDAALLWLYVTARHVLANQDRQTRRRSRLVERLAGQLAGVARREEPHDADGLVALSCLRSLSEDDREVLMLVGWEGLSPADLGRVLGCSPTAARIRLHRARTRLRIEVESHAAAEKHRARRGHEPAMPARMCGAPKEV